jgi:hypothetical protein
MFTGNRLFTGNRSEIRQQAFAGPAVLAAKARLPVPRGMLPALHAGRALHTLHFIPVGKIAAGLHPYPRMAVMAQRTLGAARKATAGQE